MAFEVCPRTDDHALYIGVLKIEHALPAATAQLSVRVFQDDLQDVLRNQYGYETIEGQATLCANYLEEINQYFRENLIFTINADTATYQLTNCESIGDVFQLTFSMTCPERWNTVVVEAPFFMELFPKQSNIITIQNGTVKRFGRTIKGNERLRVQF